MSRKRLIIPQKCIFVTVPFNLSYFSVIQSHTNISWVPIIFQRSYTQRRWIKRDPFLQEILILGWILSSWNTWVNGKQKWNRVHVSGSVNLREIILHFFSLNEVTLLFRLNTWICFFPFILHICFNSFLEKLHSLL